VTTSHADTGSALPFRRSSPRESARLRLQRRTAASHTPHEKALEQLSTSQTSGSQARR
jgi:hypothetical protein